MTDPPPPVPGVPNKSHADEALALTEALERGAAPPWALARLGHLAARCRCCLPQAATIVNNRAVQNERRRRARGDALQTRSGGIRADPERPPATKDMADEILAALEALGRGGVTDWGRLRWLWGRVRTALISPEAQEAYRERGAAVARLKSLRKSIARRKRRAGGEGGGGH